MFQMTENVDEFFRRRRKISIPCNITPTSKISPYAEIQNPQTEDSTYQELSISETEKTYHNLALK